MPAGTPVDAARRAEWLTRFQGYRVPVEEAKIEHWLGQFEAPHQDLAARLLDSVEFVSHHGMEDALRHALQELPGWHRDEAQRQGRWRFVAFGGPAGSGSRMLHHFKLANDLDWPTYDELFVNVSELASQGLGPEDSVVFIDDFAGSGDQVCGVWERSLGEILWGDPKLYLVLIAATARAVERIGQETALEPRAHRIMEACDNFMANECDRFTAEEREAVLAYCTRADKKQPRGYGECGLLLVLAHRCPNNSLPILHSRNPRFPGLFPR